MAHAPRDIHSHATGGQDPDITRWQRVSCARGVRGSDVASIRIAPMRMR